MITLRLNDELSENKIAIGSYLEMFLKKKTKEFVHVSPSSLDVGERLLPFLSQGKMLRGSLVMLLCKYFGSAVSEEVLQVASAVELIHAALIIHDDIMDQDEKRRGKLTLYAQYQHYAQAKKYPQAKHFGESMGICIGDYAIFLAFDLLTQVKNISLSQYICKEIAMVVLAQMQDVTNSIAIEEVQRNDILHMYTYKTGRYTFSLPFVTAALLTRHSTIITSLEAIGSLIGVLFQIKDDELNLFGDEEETGKSVGSDLRENKKTLYRLYLWEKASGEEKNRIQKIIHTQPALSNDLEYVYDLLVKYHIQEAVSLDIKHLTSKLKTSITQAQLDEVIKALLLELIIINEQRKK